MASTVWLAPTANYVQTTLNGAITDSATTITLNSTTNLTAPGYVVIDRTDSSGTATPNAREVVSFTGISGSDITGCTRGADGSTNRSHSNGAIVETMPTVGMWNSLATIVGSALDGSGYLKSINSPVSIAQIQSVRGFLSNITVSNSMNASGASIIGLFPSGASGGVLTNIGNNLPPVFSASIGTSWASYTPTLTNITLGNGTLAFRWSQVGKLVTLYGSLILGSTSSIGGLMGFSLPVAAAGSSYAAVGATILDSGTAFIPSFVYFGSDSRLDLYALNAAGTYLAYTETSSTVPMTWTTSDSVTFYLMYEAL